VRSLGERLSCGKWRGRRNRESTITFHVTAPPKKSEQGSQQVNPINAPRRYQITVFVTNRSLLGLLAQQARAHKMDFATYCAEILDAFAAAHRLSKIESEMCSTPFVDRRESKREAPATSTRTDFFRSMPPERIQAILHLYSENLGIATIAERCACSQTTVRRIVKTYETHPVHNRLPTANKPSEESRLAFQFSGNKS
jgi:hypothetical protein